MAPELGTEQAAVFRLLNETPHNYFITGKAGTGKSVLLQYFVSHTLKNTAVIAPTGVAAINVGGQTIHSFLGSTSIFKTYATPKRLPRSPSVVVKFTKTSTRL